MTWTEAIIIAFVEGLTEYLPVSSTAHMIFTSTFLGIEEDAFVKMFQVSIQFGAIMAVVFLYWRKFFDFSKWQFFLKLGFAVIPALILGYLFDDYIEAVLGEPLLLFIDKAFKNPRIEREDQIKIPSAVAVGFWQCLAMMPGMSRAAASIIGGMQQKFTRSLAAEFSFFLAVPTMLAVTTYSVFLKKWDVEGVEQKGYEMIMASNQNIGAFVVGNFVAFIVAALAIKFFIGFLKKYGFKVWGYYRIIAGLIMIVLLMTGVM
jgi:undecaprenyl-diphosphatase